MMKFMFPLLAGICLLVGCAGVKSAFECNATSSDSCMTMQQANEKAKATENPERGKPGVAGLPRLAEGDFRISTMPSSGMSVPLLLASRTGGRVTAHRAISSPGASLFSTSMPLLLQETRGHTATRSGISGDFPRQRRTGEQVASLWIAPYIDTDDVYHRATMVLFVMKPSHWAPPALISRKCSND